jgi:hypothetical protein
MDNAMKFSATSDVFGFLTKDGTFTACTSKESALKHAELFALPAVQIEVDSNRFKAGLSHNRMRDLKTRKLVATWQLPDAELQAFWADMARGLSPMKLARKSR